MTEKEIGKIENVPYEIKQLEWKIPDYVLVTEDRNVYVSPTFSVAGISWQLRLWPKGWCTNGFIELFLQTPLKLKYPVEYYMGFKKWDGNSVQLVSGTMKKDERLTDCIFLIKQTELLQRKSEFVSCDVFTITCTLKMMTEISISNQHAVLDQHTQSLKLIKLDKLSENFKDLSDDKETCDVTLKVKDIEYKAHRLVLMTRCSVFAATFKHDTREKQTGIITISDCDPDSFGEFLKYLYCGKLDELSFRSALNLYYTSDKYDMQELKEFCIDYLKLCLSVESICEVVNFADTYDEIELFSAAQDFFNKNVNNILATSEWESFMKMNSGLANKLFKAMPKVKFGE